MSAKLETPAPMIKPSVMRPAKRRILLVDDDSAIRHVLMRLLEEENYFVLTAANGLEALALADANKFNLVLLDLCMPVEDGWETYKQLSTKNPELPIILITARPNQFFPALASGVDALLEKPLDFMKLFQTIQSLLDEPLEARQARCLGRSPTFHFIQPIPGELENQAKLNKH